MTRRLSSRRLQWLVYMLSRQSSTVQSCSPSRLYRAATAFGLYTLLSFCSCCAASHPHSSPFFTALSPSPSLLSSRSTSHKSTLLFSTHDLLPTSVFSTNSSMSTTALSVSGILRFLWSGASPTVMSLAFIFFTMVSRSLRHFRHSSKRCATVFLLLLHHQQCASLAFPILIR
jgi:hypothetical protein